ncbi:short-chain dehydrogenase/reductase 10c [Salpingoeca rosetta]|uniref:Short-chain dehydrogenase/reductase 10c n=1 Tax=Salpingoeca rosetta (strain ATCC 50818 / BSB-021) TaxID=946362 RepID=F2U397_SALR5|nr:short-chain dehydrogenase/reductase 10c [Salpingoeca rosetta]EGD82091.1 short-chain dehydrogenase/reductase 10c [Salpingoeca rosetta]|eukprot:XP_004996274.1 short-chain dehydrogenase/reductase 10c [Salpingoeca rosetta]
MVVSWWRVGVGVGVLAVLLTLGYKVAPLDTAATLQAVLLIPVHLGKAAALVIDASYHAGFVVVELCLAAARAGLQVYNPEHVPTPPHQQAQQQRSVDVSWQEALLAARHDISAFDDAASGNDALAWTKAGVVPGMLNQAVVITGASSGIGKDVALLAAEAGAALLLAARRMERLEQVAEQCRRAGATSVHIVRYDATRPEDAMSLVETAAARLGRIDTLILNAGTAGTWSRLEDLPNTDALHWLMEVNYWGYVRATHAALPHLKRTRGRVVVVSSFYARIPAPFQAGYAATKHALHGFFDTLRPELAAHGVSVTVHCPGGVKTEVQRKFVHADDRHRHMELSMPSYLLASSRECAASVLWAAYRRMREAYFPLYAGLAVDARTAFPAAFDSAYTWVVNRHVSQDTFSLAPAAHADQEQ